MNNIMNRLESYVFMKKMLEEEWEISRKENFHNGIKINSCINLFEIEKDHSLASWMPSYKSKITHLEILYMESKFYTIRIHLKNNQKVAFRKINKYFKENKNVLSSRRENEFTFKFKTEIELNNFFDSYILGDGVCNLI